MTTRVVASVPGLRAVLSLLNFRAHWQALFEALRFLAKRRELIVAMTRRDLASRYAGQALGSVWTLAHPIFQTSLLLFVFGVVLQQKIGGTVELPRDYTIYILSGLAAWLSMSPVLTAATGSVVGNANLVKQFTFDAKVLPVKDALSNLVVLIVGLTMLMVYTLHRYGALPWTYFLLPAACAIHLLMAIGCAWILASIAVFFRDLKDIVSILATSLLYIMPVVYLPSAVPELFRPILYINPFSYLIWVFQDVLYFGRIEHPWAWLIAGFFAFFSFTAGYRLFRRLNPMFGGAL